MPEGPFCQIRAHMLLARCEQVHIVKDTDFKAMSIENPFLDLLTRSDTNQPAQLVLKIWI